MLINGPLRNGMKAIFGSQIIRNMMIRTMMFITGCLLLTACERPGGFMQKIKPNSYLFAHMPPGPYMYEQGWKDGCSTGIGAQSNDFYKSFYNYEFKPHMFKNEYYYKAWKVAFDYCRGYTYGNLKEAKLMGTQPSNHFDFFDAGILNLIGNLGPGVVGRW